MPDFDREDYIIDNFCKRFSELTEQTVTIIERPDRNNSGKSACDAILNVDGQKWALEHRRLQSYSDYFRDQDKFSSIVYPCKTNIARAYPNHRIFVTVQAFSGLG